MVRLASFDAGHGREIGAVVDRAMVPLSRLIEGLGTDMRMLIALWDRWQEPVRAAAAGAQTALHLDALRLLAPIARPGKIMAIGLNYADHIAESGLVAPERQVWFAKMATAINDPHGDIILAPVPDTHVDYEVELVAVIGRGGRRIAAAEAPATVFGWCVGNDVTERAWQHATPQWTLGKSFDTHAPVGPWITTADSVVEPHALDIWLSVNSERRQVSNTRHLVFDVWQQIEHLSQAMTLEPGDLIFTGTPGGVGAAMTPMQFLADGDVVRAEIAELGAIENRCVAHG